MRKVKRSVMDPFTSSSTGAGSLELRKKYVSIAAAEVVLEVFTNAGEIFGAKANEVSAPGSPPVVWSHSRFDRNKTKGERGGLLGSLTLTNITC